MGKKEEDTEDQMEKEVATNNKKESHNNELKE